MNKFFKRLIKQSEFYVFLIIVVLSLIIQARSGLFFANNNIVDLLRSMIVPSIYAICALLAFVSTGPDVSFPLIAALSSYLALTVTKQSGAGWSTVDHYIYYRHFIWMYDGSAQRIHNCKIQIPEPDRNTWYQLHFQWNPAGGFRGRKNGSSGESCRHLEKRHY